MSLFAPKPSSYAQEQLSVHLVDLSTLPVTTTSTEDLPSDVVPLSPDSPFSKELHHALSVLTSSTTPSPWYVAHILDKLSETRSQLGTQALADVDVAAEAEVITRSVSIIWAYVLQVFVDSALALEDDSVWWERCLTSRGGVLIYLVQSFPGRMWHAFTAKVKMEGLEGGSWRQLIETLHWPKPEMLFRPLQGAATLSQQLLALSSPLTLTRREMVNNKATLSQARDLAANRVGILAARAPTWSIQEVGLSATSADLVDETARVYGVLCEVLNIKPEQSSVTQKPVVGKTSKKRASSPPKPEVTPKALADIINKSMPEVRAVLKNTRDEFGRPSVLTRFWFTVLFLPPVVIYGASAITKNKEWIREQVQNAKETIRGFFVQWVWEPLEEIAKTMKGGGEGLAFAPETVKNEEDSLRRMVVDFGRDVYHYDSAKLAVLEQQIKQGDMESVLKAYEKEIQSPLKSALFGHLVRTLLIQIQKTKTDLSVALQQLDQLLRSQQLTFAFVGVAPAVLVVWGLGSWLGNLYRGESRGRARRRRYFHSLRSIEALLLKAPEDDARMSDRDRGMLIVTTSGLRVWATGIGSSVRQAFLDDMRMFEDQTLTRGDKLVVVQRVWRCWGRDGRLTSKA